jgi:uncharacterized protein
MESYGRDRDAVLACLTDDVEWYVPGAFRLHGKEAVDLEIADDHYISPPQIQVARLTEENDIVVAEGTVRTRPMNGEVLHIEFCDVFEMRDGKIARLISYLVVTGRSSP